MNEYLERLRQKSWHHKQEIQTSRRKQYKDNYSTLCLLICHLLRHFCSLKHSSFAVTNTGAVATKAETSKNKTKADVIDLHGVAITRSMQAGGTITGGIMEVTARLTVKMYI